MIARSYRQIALFLFPGLAFFAKSGYNLDSIGWLSIESSSALFALEVQWNSITSSADWHNVVRPRAMSADCSRVSFAFSCPRLGNIACLYCELLDGMV